MSSFKKQLLFISLGVAIILAGALVIKGATPSGKLKIDPDKTAKIKMVNQENTTSTTNNPVGWWKFDEATAIHGTLMDDSSGYGNTGTLSTGDGSLEKSVAGKLGKGLSFDGVDDYVDAGDKDDLTGTGYTYSFWVKPDDVSGVEVIIDKWDEGTYNGIMILKTSAQLDVYADVGSTNCLYNRFFSAGVWVHGVAVVDSTGCYIYKNGVLADTGTHNSITDNNENFYLGQQDGQTRFWDGLIDDVRIYNRALSAGEVLQQYNSTKDGYLGKIKMSTGLVGYWKLDDNLGTTAVRDYSGKNNNGVFSDATGNPFTSAHSVAGQIGGAMSFDGSDDYVDAGNGASLQNFTQKTILLWMKPSAFTGSYRTVYYGAYWNSPYGDMIVLKDDANSFYTYLKNTEGVLKNDTVTTFTPNEWVLYGYSWDGERIRFYKNGVQTKETAFSGILACSAVTKKLGGGYAGYTSLNGLIDDVRIYNYARTAEQIKNDYQRGISGDF